MSSHFIITENPLDVDQLTQHVSDERAGAISSFSGVTRNHTGDRKVLYLLYEAYESMATKLMGQVYEEAKEKYDFLHMVIAHRIGKVSVKEMSVFIACSSGHRKDAFKACHFAIDRLKEIVPIWKEEVFEDQQKEWIANGESIGEKI